MQTSSDSPNERIEQQAQLPADETAQHVRVPAPKTTNLSLIPKTHIVEEKSNYQNCSLTPTHALWHPASKYNTSFI